MKIFRKKITLFLMDGIPDGRIMCELANWPGKVYKLPRNMVKECISREDIKGIGVYMLFGKDSSDYLKEKVYIGETEELYSRLMKHMSEKDFWTEAIVVTSTDDSLNKAKIKFLEFEMYDLAKKLKRSNLENANTPVRSQLSEVDIAEMEEFFDRIKLMVGTLGYKLFEEYAVEKVESSMEFVINAAHGAEAKGKMANDGFLVLKGSIIANNTTPSCPKGFVKLKERLIQDNIISESGGKYIFTEDFLFSSPSAAAAVVMGRSANGLNEWKTVDGKSLKYIETGSV